MWLIAWAPHNIETKDISLIESVQRCPARFVLFYNYTLPFQVSVTESSQRFDWKPLVHH